MNCPNCFSLVQSDSTKVETQHSTKVRIISWIYPWWYYLIISSLDSWIFIFQNISFHLNFSSFFNLFFYILTPTSYTKFKSYFESIKTVYCVLVQLSHILKKGFNRYKFYWKFSSKLLRKPESIVYCFFLLPPKWIYLP